VGAKKRVLIVDDEPNVRLMLETALTSVGYDVEAAADGQSALETLTTRASAFDMVLLDLLMPRMDGMELLRQLRAVGNVIPVVILTAHGSIPEAVEAMKLGAIDFLAKPVTPDALRRVVAEVIERHAVPGGLEKPAVPTAPAPAGKSLPLASELASIKRAINRGQFSDAERLLRETIAGNPQSSQARELLDRLLALKAREERGSYRILRDWFPSGSAHGRN
jgi:DNA-binding NtrC family response regulator